ncbi:MAG: porin family protein [Pedobacter sp.]|uniref:porin family protein n=1 Tax=Pedobacter sp. TaxID=1411316 RepID=UPI002809323C|nr:porin family protein [Pedobacter sp.]MDQ8005615.1 porin family protein [Pedobacter sp.]
MKKILLIGTALLLSSPALFAQTTTIGGSDARIGVKAGVNLSKYRFSGRSENKELIDELNKNQENNVGFNVTVFGDFGVAKNFALQPGVSLQNKGTKFTDVDGTSGIEVQQSTMWIDVPINAVYSIPTGNAGAVQLSAGPYLGFGISGKNKFKNITPNEQQTDFDFGDDAQPLTGSAGMDYGANFGLGFRANNGIILGANYGLGMANLIPKDARSNSQDSKQKNRVLGFSIGYSF